MVGFSAGRSVVVCVFDLDGTLVDSRESILQSLNRAMDGHDLRRSLMINSMSSWVPLYDLRFLPI